jgi:hypothetical protein
VREHFKGPLCFGILMAYLEIALPVVVWKHMLSREVSNKQVHNVHLHFFKACEILYASLVKPAMVFFEYLYHYSLLFLSVERTLHVR